MRQSDHHSSTFAAVWSRAGVRLGAVLAACAACCALPALAVALGGSGGLVAWAMRRESIVVAALAGGLLAWALVRRWRARRAHCAGDGALACTLDCACNPAESDRR